MVLKLLTDETPEFSRWNSYLEKAPLRTAPAWRTSTVSSMAMLPHMDSSIVLSRRVMIRNGLLFS